MKNVVRLLSKAKEVGLVIPKHVNPELYKQGYEHGLKSNELTDFRASYRLGFREAKRQQMARSNVRSLPVKFRLVPSW